MDLPILFLYGIFFTVVIVCISKPELIISNERYWLLSGKSYLVSNNTRYFPLIMFMSVLFVFFASFQDVYAGIYDQPAYKSYFDTARNYSSLESYLKVHDKELIYMTMNWILHYFTDSYSVVLILFYSFMIYALVRFFYTTNQEPSFIFFLSVFCLIFSFVVQSYCIMRTGISVAAGLLVFSELQQNSKTKKQKIIKVIKIGLWTFISVGFHTLGLFIFPILVMYCIYKKSSVKVFMFCFFLFFIFGYAGQFLLTNILSLYKRFLIYSGQEINPAYKTYIANICLLFFIFFKKKSFFSNKRIGIHFVVFICSFYIYDLELLMSSIMFRMIYFTRPSTAVIIAELWKIYKLKKNEIIIPLVVRIILIVYVTFNFYGFITSMSRYGLNYYKFGGLY